MENSGPLMSLPNEILIIILQQLRCRDILNFGITCKHFHGVIKTNQCIWKEKSKDILPSEISDLIAKYGCNDWLSEIKRFFFIKKEVYEELASMSPRYYWRKNALGMADIRNFIVVAIRYNNSYKYVIHLLRDVIKQGMQASLHHDYAGKPFSLTDIHYANIILRLLTHAFLTMKWVRCLLKDELPQDVVLYFFLQWVDPANEYKLEDFHKRVDFFVRRVENEFPDTDKCHSISDKLANRSIHARKVLQIISLAIFRGYPSGATPENKLEQLDIVQAYRDNSINYILGMILYQAVARKCGINCEVVAIQGHLAVVWIDSKKQKFGVELETGALTNTDLSSYFKNYSYDPNKLLLYIASSFSRTWTNDDQLIENAKFLLEFLSPDVGDNSPYFGFMPYLKTSMDFVYAPELGYPLEMEFMSNAHLILLGALSNLNENRTNPVTRHKPSQCALRHGFNICGSDCFEQPDNRTSDLRSTIPASIILRYWMNEVQVKHRHPKLKFAVGMLVFHKRYEYLCIIRGWDLQYSGDWEKRVEYNDLKFGLEQPFYHTVAINKSTRYIAQEHIIPADRPSRLIHLEDTIAKEFAYFDGYCYMPNTEKDYEYPDEEPIRHIYRCRVIIRAEGDVNG